MATETLSISRNHALAEFARCIATDAYSLQELLTELIVAGNEAGNVLGAARLQISRMGMLADSLYAALADGRPDVRGGPADWLLADGGDDLRKAWKAISA